MSATDTEQHTTSAVSRRDFTRAGLAAGVLAAAASLTHWDTLVAQSAVTDIDILQFALNLEYLEAEFYTVATTGKTLDQTGGFTTTGEGRQGTTTGGAKVALSGSAQTAALYITRDEQSHVKFLQAALGSHAIAKPSINLNALGIGFNNQNEFLTLARAFEDVGVSAYGGAAPLIQNTTILAAAAGIALTEAQHAGVLRLLVAQTAGLSVPAVDAKDVLPLGSPNGQLFFVDGNALSVPRTTSEVLKIVLAGGDQRGGFFPDGVNGSGPLNRA